MKVVQVTTSSKGGAGIAALRLHSALQAAGIACGYVSKDLTINFKGEIISDSFFTYEKPTLLQRIKLKLQTVFSPSAELRIKRKTKELDASLQYEIMTLPFSVYELEKHPLLQEADVINLHWIGGIVQYNSFFSNIKKPLVWTLHDMNPFKGMFHYQEDETNNSIAQNVNKIVADLKQQAVSKIEKGVLVSPSQWLLDVADKSGVFESFPQKNLIANGIDLDIFSREATQDLRKKHGILPNEKVLLFVAGDLDIPRKGMDLMLDALEQIDFPLTVFTLGKGEVETSNNAVKIIPLGFMSDPHEIADCYHAADAFVLPSREDNLPNTMLESLATGTPIISFAVGGIKEHIEEGHTGILASNVLAVALAEAIEAFYNTADQYRSDKIRGYAENHFSLNKQAEAYKKVYNQLLNL